MNTKTCGKIAIAASITLLSCAAWAAQNAADNAGNYSTWPQTANNGYGFGNWTYDNLTPNGGYAGEFLGGSTGSGNPSSYNINSGSGKSWAFYANQATAVSAQAIAPFLGGSLGVGQTFSVQMQNYLIATGGTNGFSLQNSSGGNLFSFYFVGGQSDYYINVGGNQVSTGVGYTGNGLDLSFTQGGGDTWSFVISGPTVTTTTLTSTGTGDLLANNNIGQVDLYNESGASTGGGGSGSYDLFFNNLSVVPEPSTLAMLGMSGLSALMFFRRRK